MDFSNKNCIIDGLLLTLIIIWFGNWGTLAKLELVWGK
jgi:hypothetical protein